MENQSNECCETFFTSGQINLSAMLKDYELWIEKLRLTAETLNLSKMQFNVFSKNNVLISTFLEKFSSGEKDIRERIGLYQEASLKIREKDEKMINQLMAIHHQAKCDFCRFSHRIQVIVRAKEEAFLSGFMPFRGSLN